MALKQHITELHIQNYRQFRRLHLNFCDPVTDEPLEKICFIGPNGTGKSTLLHLLSRLCQSNFTIRGLDLITENTLVCWQIQSDGNRYFVLWGHGTLTSSTAHFILPGGIENSNEWRSLWCDDTAFTNKHPLFQHFLKIGNNFLGLFEKQLALHPNGNDLAIHSLADGVQFLGRVPPTSLSDALAISKELPAFHFSNAGDLSDFWNFLIYQIKKRESDYQAFLANDAVQTLSVAEARRQFDMEHPDILAELAKQWNLILDQAGLEFDIKNAKIPVQLNENLEAYIRLKNSDIDVDYNLLSAGVRNFIFRLGHIYTLYFNRHIERGFLFLDEPEQSLYPDLLYDIIDRYLAIIHNTQLFVATHSEIIAAQFKPTERIRLQFEDDGSVSWRRGVSPEGDDPNDLLLNDFSVRSLYGKAGIKQWRRYQQLRREIVATNDLETKTRLMDEYLAIGTSYNFAPDEIPA